MSNFLTPEQLRSFVPLNALSDQQWRELRNQLVPQPLWAGQVLFRQGDQAQTTYYLLSGELQLQTDDGPIERLQVGSEASCHPISPAVPRLQEVRALSDATVLALDSPTLARMLSWHSAYQDLLLALAQEGQDIEWLEQLLDNQHIRGIVDHYQALGFKTAMDDFGAGYSGLNLLADFLPDIIKLDMHLLRGIDQDPTRQAIVRHCLALFAELKITPLAEGIETREEMACLREMGISLMQGYLFARPGFETLPEVDFASL